MVTAKIRKSQATDEGVIRGQIKPGTLPNRHDGIALPIGWRVQPLSSIASIRTGPFGSSLHESDYVEDGTPIITVEHLSERGIVHKGLPMVSDENRLRLAAYELRTSDIVFSRVGSIDRSSLVTEREDGWLFSGRLLRVRTSDSSYAPYLNYHFEDELFKRQVRSVAVGQTMASLNTEILGNVSVILPPLSEQRAIAAALSDVDGLLDSLDALIAKKQMVKQAAMQHLLTGRTRLPEFIGEYSDYSTSPTVNTFEEGSMSRLRSADASAPEGWKAVRLGDIVTSHQGGTPSRMRGEYWGGDIPFVTAADLTEFRIGVSNSRSFLTSEGLNSGGTAVCEPGKILLATRTRVGQVAIADVLMGASQDITVLSPIRWVDPTYLYSTLVRCAPQLQNNTRGTTIQGVTQFDVNSLPILLPTLNEQRAIATVLSDMDSEIEALERRRNKTEAVKQAMMQELLNGRIRLVEAG